MLRNRVVLALVVWTFLVWTTRIGNIWRDDDLDDAGKLGRTGLALSFTVLALAVVVFGWRKATETGRRALLALAGWTVAVWVVRSTAMLAGDWDAGFKVVHTLLALVSIALAVLALRSIRATRVKGSSDHALTVTHH